MCFLICVAIFFYFHISSTNYSWFISQGGELSPLLYNVDTDDLNHLLQATGVGCYVVGAWVNSQSYADDMVLLAPTVTALQTLLEVCRTYVGPRDTEYNTTKTVWMLVWPKQSQGRYRYSTRLRLGNEELNFVEEFRYLIHVTTADCRDDKDIKKQFRRENAVGNMLVNKFSFAPNESKIQLFRSYCYPIYGCAFWRHSFKNSISYSDIFKRLINVPMQDAPARV